MLASFNGVFGYIMSARRSTPASLFLRYITHLPESNRRFMTARAFYSTIGLWHQSDSIAYLIDGSIRTKSTYTESYARSLKSSSQGRVQLSRRTGKCKLKSCTHPPAPSRLEGLTKIYKRMYRSGNFQTRPPYTMILTAILTKPSHHIKADR